MKRKSPRPVAPVAVDPNAPVFAVGDKIEVIRPNLLWVGCRGEVREVHGGICVVQIGDYGVRHTFHADIPAAELKKLCTQKNR